jgi:pimeloyl-ACP methyl ester carboxylesterase
MTRCWPFWRGPWSAAFAVDSDGATTTFAFADGKLAGGGVPQFSLAAPDSVWAKFLAPVPPRHHHAIFALLARVPDFSIRGDNLAFLQHAHVVRRVLEIGKWLALDRAAPVPGSLHPPLGSITQPPVATGCYVPVTAGGTTYHIYHERAGSGRDLLCLHTAGADGRQFHRLMADPRITASHRMVAFDLPWHGRSPPPAGGIPGAWRLGTDLYVALIMGFIEAAALDRPIVLARRCRARSASNWPTDIPTPSPASSHARPRNASSGGRRRSPTNPQINAGYFVPEWIRGLIAPQSPAECVADITWHYGQGGPAVFFGDIEFYAGDWDASERVGRIDTNRCRLFMLTGEYDYSCTVEHSAATAAKIPGARFQPMAGIGHFPFAENPALFAEYLLPILRELGG